MDDFSLGPAIGGGCPLLFRGQPAKVRVEGTLIEQQLRCRAGYLLFVSSNCPYEEALHIYLLGGTLEVLDEIELSHPYTPGILDRFRIAGEGEIRFSFFGGDEWRLTILETPRRAVARSSPAGAKRPARHWLARRYLALSRTA